MNSTAYNSTQFVRPTKSPCIPKGTFSGGPQTRTHTLQKFLASSRVSEEGNGWPYYELRLLQGATETMMACKLTSNSRGKSTQYIQVTLWVRPHTTQCIYNPEALLVTEDYKAASGLEANWSF